MPAQASPIPISDVLLAHGFGCLTDSPGLPQVTPLVCGDDVQPGGEAEADSANEWVREPHAREIDASVGAQKRSHLFLRGQERRERIAQGR